MSTEERAAAAFGTWRERVDRGERVDPEDVIRAHPDLAVALRRQFDAMRLVARAFGGPGPAAGDVQGAWLAGRTLGRWRLVSVLGGGGMGTVFLAQDGEERAAVKVLHPHLMARRGFVERFRREALIGTRVRDPNVVATLAVGSEEVGGQLVHYLVMEHVEGQTLRALLDELGRVPEALCRHVGREMARALAAIHAAGAVHRDLKPENVIVTREHAVKVMDLGVARLRDEALRISHVGAFVGSVQYGSPEQFSAPESVDARADLHGLGLVLYELATGVHPFHADAFHAVVRRVLDETPRPAADINPQLSPFLEDLLAQLLEKDRAKRPASAEDVARILEEGEESAWWRERAVAIRSATRRPLRRMRIPRETALYGRDAEIAKLRARFDAAKSGHGQVVLVEGEAGVGKSRLVDEFVGQLQHAGEDLNFLYGSYPPGGAATASGAFTTAYREHLGDDEAALRAALPQTPLLAPAFAALLRGDVAPTDAQPLMKDSLQSVFVHATRSLAAQRPTIVLIDDLHFAPPEGRALFAALALGVPGHRILLVGAARPGLDEKWLAQVERVDHATRLALPRLSPKDLVRLLADSLKSKHLAEELAGKIATKSDGNPFFVFEILRGLREGQFITKRSDGTWATTREIREIQVPSSVVDLVQARVSDLNRSDRNVLEVASCVGFEFDPAFVGDVLGIERIPVLQTLGAVEKSHRLVRSVGRRFVFDHHQVMEVLYAGLSEPLREEYHAAIAAALEARNGAASREPKELEGPLCVALAEHFLKGAQGARALRYLDPAIAHLERSYAHGTALALIDRALGAPGVLTGRARGELLLTKAFSLDELSRREEERGAIDEALSIADALGDVALSAKAHMRRGRHLVGLARFAEAVPELTSSAEFARRTGDYSTEVAAVWALGSAALGTGRLADALVHFGRHLEICRERQHRRGESYALGNLGLVLTEMGRGDEGRAMHERHLAIAREVGDRRSESAALMQIGLLHIDLGQFEQARDHLERARSIAADIGDRQNESLVVVNLGNVEALDGRIEAALECFHRRLALCEESGDPRGQVAPLVNRAALLRACGRFPESRTTIERALRIARDIGHRRFETSALQELAWLDDEEGDAAAAERHSSEALVLRRKIGQRSGEASNLVQHGTLHVQSGRAAEARADLEAALALVREQPEPIIELLARAWLARLPDGDVPIALAALADLEGRVGKFCAMQARFLLWQATGDRAHVEEARRRLDDLVAHAPPALRDSMLANVRLHKEILAARGSAGVPTEPRPS
jgi:tetratricopeptide (TPR) repeat protein